MPTTGWHHLLLAGFVACAVSSVHAQVSTYEFSQSNGTYSAITGTSLISSSWDNDLATYTFPSGSFTFNGVAYTEVKVNSNGYVTFGSTASQAAGLLPISATTGYAGAVSAFGRDLMHDGLGTSSIAAAQSGNEIVIQWTNARRSQVAGVPQTGDVLNFQIRLDQTTGAINVVYGTCTTTSPAQRFCQVGLRGADDTDFNNRYGLVTSGSWTLTTAGAGSAYTVASYNTMMPASGFTFTWTPSTDTGMDDRDAQPIGINTYPVPSHGTLNTAITLETAADLSAQLLDATGRVVAEQREGQKPAGSHLLTWNVEGLAPGLYTCRVMAGDGQDTVRVVVQR